MINKAGFRVEDEKTRIPYEKYLGEYIVVTTINGNVNVGRYSGISPNRNLILNPHQNYSYENLASENFLCEEDMEITPTNRKNLENAVRYINCLEKLEEEKRSREFKKERPTSSKPYLF